MKNQIAIACLLVAPACLSADLNVPDGAVITCDTNLDCPASFVCNPSQLRCIHTHDDFVPPAFVPGTFSITPLVGNAGAEIVVEFEVDEELADIPVVKLGDPGPSFTLSAGSPPEYVFTYTVTGDEAEGDIGLVIYLVDTVGNEATLGGMDVTLDFTDPAVLTSSITPANPVTQGDVITVEFTVSEPLGRAPEVVLMTTLPEAFIENTFEPDYTFALDSTGIPAGSANVRVTLTDPGDNVTEVVLGSVTIE